ncbi:hypothetical protein [Rhodoglobus aureus]|uniref:hypothetical protein n=1 Tax=Rhodoglobus aureus TaxID=191497 RepID=UPI0031DA2C09
MSDRTERSHAAAAVNLRRLVDDTEPPIDIVTPVIARKVSCLDCARIPPPSTPVGLDQRLRG